MQKLQAEICRLGNNELIVVKRVEFQHRQEDGMPREFNANIFTHLTIYDRKIHPEFRPGDGGN